VGHVTRIGIRNTSKILVQNPKGKRLGVDVDMGRKENNVRARTEFIWHR
jgi:hypothetical protein